MKITEFLTKLGTMTAPPEAFLIVLAYAGAWIALDRSSMDWHGGGNAGDLAYDLIHSAR